MSAHDLWSGGDEDEFRVEDVRCGPPDLKEYGIYHLPEVTRRGLKLFLVCGTSTKGQVRRGNLEDEMMQSYLALRQYGVTLVGVHCRVRLGTEPCWLSPVARRAREVGAQVIVAESLDRLVRPSLFDPQEFPFAPYECHDLGRLRDELFGVPEDIVLATLMPPDTPGDRVRDAQSHRGGPAWWDIAGRPGADPACQRRWHKGDARDLVIDLAKAERGVREIVRMTTEWGGTKADLPRATGTAPAPA
jgi:hypothetical protein